MIKFWLINSLWIGRDIF